jgi:tRNA pseudouridine55 synthase
MCPSEPLAGALRAGIPPSGILNIHKPIGMTSHDVVNIVRRITQERRVGHAGTLDPMASGVLVVCLGKATRLSEYLADGAKSYLATLHFGVITSTWDAEGEVTEQHDISALSLEVIAQVLMGFLGEILQVPPMYSAIKRDGRPLYRLARQGITVEREARNVAIHALRVVSWQPPELVLQVECSKGTYVRSLAYDIGQAVGVGAHLANLSRVAVGHFRLEEAVTLEALRAADTDGLWKRYLQPMRAALSDMPSVEVGQEMAQRIVFGQFVALDVPQAPFACAYRGEDEFLAILKYEPSQGLWKPEKLLLAP